LVRLIDDLLDIARITQDKLTLAQADIRLSDVLGAAVEIAQPWLDAGGHRFGLSLPPREVVLHADPVRLAQVFANLLNNAAKYSDAGGRIDVDASVADAGVGDEVVVSVRDNGIGLTGDQLDAVFDVFRQ